MANPLCGLARLISAVILHGVFGNRVSRAKYRRNRGSPAPSGKSRTKKTISRFHLLENVCRLARVRDASQCRFNIHAARLSRVDKIQKIWKKKKNEKYANENRELKSARVVVSREVNIKNRELKTDREIHQRDVRALRNFLHTHTPTTVSQYSREDYLAIFVRRQLRNIYAKTNLKRAREDSSAIFLRKLTTWYHYEICFHDTCANWIWRQVLRRINRDAGATTKSWESTLVIRLN